MLTKQEKHELLAAAIAGDEQALERVVHEFDGWIWRQYTQQRVRPKAEDWYHECRLVMYRCLAKLPQQHWGVLTSYFQPTRGLPSCDDHLAERVPGQIRHRFF
ncbi:hypothetical protein IE337_01090 [Weissella viridescens]|uniref:hypothetical protein n=1 Tax=Weissella viridescens TaxID=1629 RepID=UPI001747AD84|nr:hypothetical protein [Weissella viridescens]QOD86241.1 hypothetical protein IE337_01090 [Weissella viridescens]